MTGSDNAESGEGGVVRYAVVGLGHIAQVAVLPAFANAQNSVLVALVSGDAEKREALQRSHNVALATDYDGYDELVASGEVDAVYIALPNHLHRDFTLRAARADVHVLCEKPLAVSEAECEQMIRACEDAGVRLMTAYRLHFEAATLEVAEIARSGRLGDVRFFTSSFSQDMKAPDSRLIPLEQGGGSVFDLGVYCINAARNLFREEPIEVTAFSEYGRDDRFVECDEMTSVLLRFPHGQLASFTTSFGATSTSSYRIVGTEGEIIMDPAYGYAMKLSYQVFVGREKQAEKFFPKRDQFAPQLIHFSDCILRDREPGPDGHEGMADVRVVEAVHRAAESGEAVTLAHVPQRQRPGLGQIIDRPAIASTEPPELP